LLRTSLGDGEVEGGRLDDWREWGGVEGWSGGVLWKGRVEWRGGGSEGRQRQYLAGMSSMLTLVISTYWY
jgi:hypothetical protein